MTRLFGRRDWAVVQIGDAVFATHQSSISWVSDIVLANGLSRAAAHRLARHA